jgi:2-oxoglutarate ferredoxin oxidoreductase subunit alpha
MVSFRRLNLGRPEIRDSMPEDLNWAIGGEAGDGIDSTGKIFAQALSRAGRHVFTSKDFASRIRGGYTAYKVRTGVEPVESVVDRLDILIALTERTVDENMDELHDGSIIIYDGERTMMQDFEAPEGMVGLDVPLKRLAEDAGGAIMRNIVALGAAAEVAEFPIEKLDESLEKRFGGKGQAIVENNREAARLGAEYVQDEYDLDTDYELETTDADYVLLNGDEAIGMGAIAAGCRFYAGYPITPATDVMEYLTGRIDRYGGKVVQAEDELSAINMALGAARAGARSMTATSGPGIDLMTETFGLIAQTETPLVICDVMRSGPSTGMPTKQEQGDLNMTLYGGHGEIPRFVVAPTTVAECFHKTIEAFNLAEKYQTPVYLVSDLSLAVTEQTFPPEEFDMDAVEIDRGNVVGDDSVEEWQDEQGRFKPHAATEDGVSPRSFPGTAGGAHMTTGLEHDELGRRTEDTDVRVEQVDKRNRKVETAKANEDWSPREFGDPDAETLVVSWGSNEGAMREAMEFLAEDGIEVRFLSCPYMFPRTDLTEEIEAAEEVIVVECNATGQFADVLEHDTLTRVDRINKYTGVRFKADELAGEIKDHLGVAAEGGEEEEVEAE